MTALTMPARHDEDAAGPRPVPWRRMAWVTWRQHRFALAGVAVLLGGLALYLWLTGLQLHHAYAIVAACHPASSYACQNQVINFDSAYGSPAQTVGTLLIAVPILIGAFAGAPILARELETGTFRYAWTLGVGRRRWTLAKLVPLAVTLAVATALFSLVFSWYYQPLYADGTLAGMLIRRVVPAIAATLAACTGLTFVTALYLRQHYLAPLTGRNLLTPPASAWVLGGWWTKGGTVISQSTVNQLMNTMFQQVMPALLPKNVKNDDIKFYKGTAVSRVLNDLVQHGYTQWTSYQPASRFWPFQWIEGGWLLLLAALLIAVTIWLVHRRAA
jgi:hypothetical protein